jgi:ubiquinone/menaquinone biosynthesis C-methylase UbiE
MSWLISGAKRLRTAFMRAFFAALYNQMAWTYDLVAAVVSVGMWTTWVRSALAYLKGPQVLELGHGPGHLQSAFHQRATGLADAQITGLDKSKQMGSLAFRRLTKQGFTPRLVHGDAQTLPFPNESFNQVVATFPSEYISSTGTLEEVRRVLAPGGQLIILPVAWITGQGLLHRLAAKLFQATGQAPEWDDRYLEPARERGFEVQVERLTLKGSQVLVLVITKGYPSPDLFPP